MVSGSPVAGERQFRLENRFRLIGFVGVLVALNMARVLVSGPPGPATLVALVFGVPITVYCFRWARCRVVADAAGVTVVNPASTVRLDWADIERFELGSWWVNYEAKAVLRSGVRVPLRAIGAASAGHVRAPAKLVGMVADLNALLAASA